MTRARDFLYVTWPLRYYHRRYSFTDRHSYAQLCRFLTDDVCLTLDHVDLGQDEIVDEEVDYSMGDDIPSRIRSMWE